MILVSKFMVYRALSDKKYLSLGLLSPLILWNLRTMRAGTISKLLVPKLINNMPNPILFSIMELFEPFRLKT